MSEVAKWAIVPGWPLQYGVRVGEGYTRSWKPAARVSYEGLSVTCGVPVFQCQGGPGEEKQMEVNTTLTGELTDREQVETHRLPPGTFNPGSQQSFSYCPTRRTGSHIPTDNPLVKIHLCVCVSMSTSVCVRGCVCAPVRIRVEAKGQLGCFPQLFFAVLLRFCFVLRVFR